MRVTLTLVPSGNTVSRWALKTRFGWADLPGPHADHVAGFIDADIVEMQFFEEALEFQAALVFVEGRGGDLADLHLQIQRMRCVGAGGFHGGTDRGFFHEYFG